MTTLFHLVRHADHGHVGAVLTGRLPGVGLSPKGRAQAQALARRMSRMRLDALFASPQRRAIETAGFIASATGVAAETANEIDEIDFGDWAGQGFDALERDPAWRRWNAERDAAETPAGDSMRNVARRLVGFLDELRQLHPGGAVALVSHSDVIKAGLCRYRGMPFQAVHDFEIAPASVTTLSLGEDGAAVLAVNEAAEAVLEEAIP